MFRLKRASYHSLFLDIVRFLKKEPDLIKCQTAATNAKRCEPCGAAGDQEDNEGGVEDVVEGEDGLRGDQGQVQGVGEAGVLQRVAVAQGGVEGPVDVGQHEGDGEEEGEEAEEDADGQLERSRDLQGLTMMMMMMRTVMMRMTCLHRLTKERALCSKSLCSLLSSRICCSSRSI